MGDVAISSRTELPRSHVERLQAKSPEVLFSVLIKDLRTDLCRRNLARADKVLYR